LIDRRLQAVFKRLEGDDRREREHGLPSRLRARQIPPTTGRFLMALVAHHPGCSVLELGASRGYSSIWLGAAVRPLGGRVLSFEIEPERCAMWRRNISQAGLDEWVELIEGDALEILPDIEDVFDVVFIDAEKEDYEQMFQAAREKVEVGAVFVADNVLSHEGTLGAYSRARQDDPTLVSVTVPLDNGLEVSVVVG
jgi:predicted O-methyltransferase YrrM